MKGKWNSWCWCDFLKAYKQRKKTIYWENSVWKGDLTQEIPLYLKSLEYQEVGGGEWGVGSGGREGGGCLNCKSVNQFWRMCSHLPYQIQQFKFWTPKMWQAFEVPPFCESAFNKQGANYCSTFHWLCNCIYASKGACKM